MTIALAAVAIGYTAIALSPLPHQIARSSPEKASMFRPILFNFFAKYDEGDVLGFKIGSSREQIFGALVAQYKANGLLQAGCGREKGAAALTVAESNVAIRELYEARKLIDREAACLWLPARQIMLVLRFQEDKLRAIDLAYVRVDIAT